MKHRLALGVLLVFSSVTFAAGRAKHVVVVVMDGLRPDVVTPEYMPTLAALGRSGTFFANHHPVYLSSTEVNGTALATGMAPAHSGVVGNREYRPDVELLQPVDTQSPWASWKGDKVRTDGWVRAATLPQLARAAGLKTAVAGTKAVAMLWDRSLENRSVDSPTVFEGRSIPSAVLDKVQPELGPLPMGVDWKHYVNSAQDAWTVRVMTEKLWADGLPELSVIWLSEPDFSQHGTGPGSDNSKRAYKSSDDRLATVLATLERKKVRELTDVVVVSDHGFSTISRNVDVGDNLRRHGFKADWHFDKAPEKGQIMVVGLGGTVSFYVAGHDEQTLAKLVAYLQTTDYAGVIFTRQGLEGTFKLSEVRLDSPGAPDVVMAMRWDEELGQGDLPGRVVAEGGLGEKQGMHGSLSPYDMHNTLIAAGPDFKAGFVNRLPSANSDVAPTLAQILGIRTKEAMDGRVLGEALVDGAHDNATPQTTTLEARRDLVWTSWSQYLRITTYQGRRYFDRGNTGNPPEE